MNLKQTIKLAAKSIAARKGRTFLTMLGIIIGLAAVIILVTYAQGTTKQMMEYYESQGTNTIDISANKWTGGADSGIFDKLYNYCLGLDNLVLGVTPNQSAWGATIKYGAKNSSSMQQSGTEPPRINLGSDQWGVCNNATIVSGRDISRLDIQNFNQVCVLSDMARELFFDYADPVGQTIQIDGVPFTVVGVYEQRITDPNMRSWMDNFILIPYTVSRNMVAAGSQNFQNYTSYSQFVVKAKDKASTTEAITRLSGFLKGLIGEEAIKSGYGSYYVQTSNTGKDYADEAAKKQQLLLGGIAAISLVVGGIGIMNIMLVTVTERTREIGIRKAIGAERKSIIVQFLIEACMICGIGGIIGILVGYVGSLIFCKVALQIIMLPGVGITVGSFVISVGLGIIFGLYPAIKASGLQPVEALRAE